MTITNRIARIESMIGKNEVSAILLQEPSDASEEAWDTFEQKACDAMKDGHSVVIHSSGAQANRHIVGAIYQPDGFSAQLCFLSLIPADDRRYKSRLEQIIAEAQGTTLPIVRGRDS